MRLGEILIANGAITNEQLEKALEEQRKEGGLIGILLCNLGYITQEQLVKAIIDSQNDTNK